MTYAYKILVPQLHDTANAAIAWFEQRWGLPKKAIKVEEAVDPDIELRPTFVAQTRDQHVLCIEVAETIYTNTLDSFVLDCREKGLPVKLFVAVQKGVQDPDYAKKLGKAKRAGVGIFEVDSNSGIILQGALSLSLTNVRPIELTSFSKKYREGLQQAEQTFRDGQPAKACALIYDELENAFRRFSKKCATKGLWPNGSSLDIDKTAWATLITNVDRYLDRSSPLTKDVTQTLLARVHGITTHRNESGHKPKNPKELNKRDRELRTRFEGGVDLLRDFIGAAKGLGI